MQDAFNGEEISPIPTEEVFEQSEYRRKQEWDTKLPGIVGVGLFYKFVISLQTGRLSSSNGASSSATPHASLGDVKKRNAETLSALFYLAYKLDEKLEVLSDERKRCDKKNSLSLSLSSKYGSQVGRKSDFLSSAMTFSDLYTHFPANKYLLSAKSEKAQISESVSILLFT